MPPNLTKGTIMKIKVFLCALLVGMFAMADELLTETVKTYDWMRKSAYSVNMASPELAGLVGLAIQMKMQQMGIQIPIKIRNFMLKSDVANGISVKVGLDIPDETQRKQMETQLNQMMTSMGFSKAMGDCSIGAIGKLIEYIEKNADSFTQTAESTEAVAQYVCDSPAMVLLGGKSVNKILVNVNKQYKIIPAVRFDFAEGAALIQFSHDMVQGRACPLKMMMRHTIKQQPGGMMIPPSVTATMSDYKFQ